MEKSARFHGRNNPSFSSSLLDAIYRSIDESDGGSPGPALSSASNKRIGSIDKKWIPTPPLNLRRHISTSSSSDCSSFGGFSSSDADSSARPRPRPRPRPILTRCDHICSVPPPERKMPGSIRSRIRDLRNSKAPASPGARLAAFLNAIFAGGGGNPKKPKFTSGQEESAIPCISKMPAPSRDGKQRSVRFSPASIAAVEDCREKRRSGEVPVVERDRRMVLEELLRGFDIEEEESDCESVSSSELFELESLSAIGRFGDELPVYGTTNLMANRAIARGFVV